MFARRSSGGTGARSSGVAISGRISGGVSTPPLDGSRSSCGSWMISPEFSSGGATSLAVLVLGVGEDVSAML
jgi:hypothetical protein